MNELKCVGCGHENDSTRVFCHNCGIRLERAEGNKPTIAENSPVLGRTSGPVRRGFFGSGGGAGSIYRLLRSLVSLAILGALIAVLIQMASEPEGIPVSAAVNETKASQLYEAIKGFADTVYPRTIDLTEAQANNFLASRIVPGEVESGLLRAKFVRALVKIDDGNMQFVVEQQYLGHSVFMVLTFVPKPVGDVTTGQNTTSLQLVGAGVGRMSFPAVLAPALQVHLQGVIDSASQATDLLGRADSLYFLSGVARVGWNGTKKPGG